MQPEVAREECDACSLSLALTRARSLSRALYLSLSPYLSLSLARSPSLSLSSSLSPFHQWPPQVGHDVLNLWFRGRGCPAAQEKAFRPAKDKLPGPPKASRASVDPKNNKSEKHARPRGDMFQAR